MREHEIEDGEEEGNFQECLDSLKEEDIVPFTEGQLHALYHNVELEKNAEFVEHWLETQAELAKFPLHELLASYLRLRGLQAAAAREHAALAAAAAAAMETLWEL